MVIERSSRSILRAAVAFSVAAVLAAAGGCEEPRSFDPTDPARGPSEMVGNDRPRDPGEFAGGSDTLPSARATTPPDSGQVPDCGRECLQFCEAAELSNPVNAGLCTSLWGVGLEPQPIVDHEACRRLIVDMTGRFPTYNEVRSTCQDRSWGEIVRALIDSEEFVQVNQRRWADRLMYNTQVVSVERIFDMDRLVGKMYRGQVAYDEFAAVVSAHPVLTRRYGTAGDRAEALFTLFLARPPLGHERSDMARLYVLWTNDYYNHAQLGMRLPDSFIRYRCVDDAGRPDPDSKGECTSVLYGYNELILTPDIRTGVEGRQMWSGLLRADEWQMLQLPGRLLSGQHAFWEKAVDDVLDQYLGYDLGTLVPEVRDQLVRYLLSNDGDIRAVHYAVATSIAYLQSSSGTSATDHRWTYGPLKQVDAEVWLDSIKHTTGYDLGQCDHRISEPREFQNAGTIAAMALLENSHWQFDDQGRIRTGYRDLARNLGGCPANDASSRFRIVSILTTAMQLNYVNQVCNPAFEPRVRGADVARLLPPDVVPDQVVTPELAEDIVRFQVERFFGRPVTPGELADARVGGEACERERCRAEEFVRPACFALLSSSEMLFY